MNRFKSITAEINKINQNYPIGTPVVYGDRITTISSPAVSMNGNIVIWCKNVSGCVDVEYLRFPKKRTAKRIIK